MQGDAAVHALAGVDLTFNAGEFVAIMGPSGSGKSTAMNVIGCLDTPTGGEYLFNGVSVGELSHDQRTLAAAAFSRFRVPGLQPAGAHDGGRERRTSAHLSEACRSASAGNSRLRALKRVGLEGREHHTSAALSGGQQQRVAIARAIVTDPDVLLADEPTGNLDTKTSREIMELVTSLNRDQGITVIMVTHETDIAAYAERTVRFRRRPSRI